MPVSEERSVGLESLGRAVRHGRLSAVDLIHLSHDRVEKHDGAINSVISTRWAGALREAAAMDASISAGVNPGPLAGLPLLVKDNESVRGLPTTFGSDLFKSAGAAASDGPVVAALRRSGAIVIGKTNLSEFAVNGHSENSLYGAVRNPWNTRYSAGGSSGGSGAALAAGLTAIATSTDGGGSTRIPAALCGLVGLKPTNGAIGRTPSSQWLTLSTDGVLASSVDDARLLLSVLATRVSGDPNYVPVDPLVRLRRPDRVVASAVLTSQGEVSAVVQTLFEAAVTDLAGILGAETVWLDGLPFGPQVDPDDDWLVLAAAEQVHALGREVVTREARRFGPSAQEFLEFGLTVDITSYLDAQRRRWAIARCLDDCLGSDGVLVSPTLTVDGYLPDGRLNHCSARGLMSASVFNTGIHNLTGHPAVSVPVGAFESGLPFGLQLTGPRCSDYWLLDIAARLEAARPWPRCAAGYTPFRLDLA